MLRNTENACVRYIDIEYWGSNGWRESIGDVGVCSDEVRPVEVEGGVKVVACVIVQ